MKVDMEKLLNVPYIQDYRDNPKFQEYCEQYVEFWGSQTPEGLDSVALVRAVECTNGIVQYSYRDGDPWALDTEQTRLCMKTSMSFIKTKELPLPDGTVVKCDPSVVDALNKVRDIYIQGFKMGDEESMMEFYAQSIAQFYVIGREKLNEKCDFVAEHFKDVFGEFMLKEGRDYIMSYLNAMGK